MPSTPPVGMFLTPKDLKTLHRLLGSYGQYIETDNPLAAQFIAIIISWINDELREQGF